MSTKKTPKTASPKKAAKKAAAKAYHHGDLRRALVEAARAELVDVGRDHLSLRSVARRANVTHTSAYHHFADKDALLAVIAAEGFAALDASMKHEMDAASDDPAARLRAAGIGYLKMAAHDPAAYDLMFNASGMNDCVEVQVVGASAFQRLFEAVVAVRAARGTRIGDDMTDAMLMWETVHGCAMLTFSGQLSRMGIDASRHGTALLERLTGLYPAS